MGNCRCAECVYNQEGEICLKGRYIGWEYCRYFQKKETFWGKAFRFCKKVLHWFSTFAITLFACALVFGAMLGYFFWTKNSLEELSGKKVSNSTVLWTMFVTQKGK